MSTSSCCGRPSAEECRCYTDAAAIAQAVHAFVSRRVRRPHDAGDITQETLLRLYRSAGALHDEQALELTDLGGMTQGDAAARLGLSVSGMKSRVQRGRRMLREEIGRCCRGGARCPRSALGCLDSRRHRGLLSRSLLWRHDSELTLGSP